MARMTAEEQKNVVALYTGPRQMSIRDIAAETGRSYGAVHRTLENAGVEMRKRGGTSNVATRADDRRRTRAPRSTDVPSVASLSGGGK